MRKISPLTVAMVAGLLWLAFYAPQTGGCNLPSPFTPTGPRTIYVVREAGGNVPTEVQALAVALQDGPTGPALRAKGHKLLILDNDDEAIAKFKPFDDSKSELLICDGDKLLSREPLPLTVDAFLAALKARGIQ